MGSQWEQEEKLGLQLRRRVPTEWAIVGARYGNIASGPAVPRSPSLGPAAAYGCEAQAPGAFPLMTTLRWSGPHSRSQLLLRSGECLFRTFELTLC